MIDDEFDFGDITDAPAEVQAAPKFRPNMRAKPRKPSVPSRPVVPNRSVETSSEKVGALSQDNLSQGLATNQEIASSTVLRSETIFDSEAHEATVHTPSDDVLTVSAVDTISQSEEHDDNQSEVAAHQENLVVSDTQASSTYSTSKTFDDLADFGGLCDTHIEEERVAKFKPNKKVKLSKAASKSRKTDQKAVASAVDVASQNEEDSTNNLTGCSDKQLQAPRHQEHVQISDSQPTLGTDGSTVDNFSYREEPVQEETVAELSPKSQRKPDGEDQNNDLCQKSTDQEAATVQDTWPPHDINDTVDLDSQDGLINSHTDDTQAIFGESSAEATGKFLPNDGRKKGKRKSVTFVLPGDSEVVAPTDTNSEDCNNIRTDESLNTLPQQTAQKHCLTEELSDDGEYTDKESQYHEGALSDHGVKEQSKMNGEKLDLSMRLRNRRKEVGVSEHITDDIFDEDYAEPSAAEQDNDSGDEYTVGEKQKPQRKSKEKDPNKAPMKGSRRTSKNSSTEKPAQQSQQKNKSEGQSRGRKRALKDALTEQPEKKLTHRIRQKRTKVSEVQTLLAKPDHEIDRMKLSVMHLRLLQEARERIQSKTIPSGPSSSNQSSSLYGDTDDFDPFGDNYANDRTENDASENGIKLNYHSYMNRKTRARWTKSDTDLFYQGLQQFGSDFAMIQQLFPDKSRDQVRQKFKSEEKKHPMQVHDAIIHRSKDNVYLKQVIKQLNIEDLQRDINSADKQEVASNEGDTGNENVSHVIDEEEDNGPNWSDDELGTHQSEVKEGDHASGNADDDDLDVFDWY
ncbi:uncharacterized protein LOC124707413 isoform X3 [Lolium rigidum]|uniref:uncharacterized protein LOC124707413 isoform X3 n=1 Tax=Lolium rigidum TaxID=89674 RepID=UPI001F5D662C|nr:uncharacterized protein LOC124707413 isoform X3 [Lolium rigidum]